MQKSTLEMFRDCLKTIPHMVKQESKIKSVRALVKSEFLRNKHLTDQEEIENLRQNAVRGLSNYFLLLVKEEYLNNPEKYQKPQNIFGNDNENQDQENKQ